MEPPELTKTESGSTKTKRRISSILKAPRTPLKCIGTDNEDCQDEATKPIEKKRNSRRVSFASTNDIHVFIKDFKNGPPVENFLQDLSGTGEEMLDQKGPHTVKDGGQHITGMETLLNAPLHVPKHHNKVKSAYTGANSDVCDKTVVFSEDDTAFMDMTHSHTIIIDNKEDGIEAALSSCENFGFTPAVGKAKTVGFEESRKDGGTAFKSCSAPGKGPIEESEMEDFLASLSQPSGCGSFPRDHNPAVPCREVPSPVPKVAFKDIFAKLNARKSTADQENKAPVAAQQQQNLWFNDKTVSVEQDDMDMTRSHTAVIDGKGMFKNKSFPLSEEQEDMEMTRSQTVVIKTKICNMVNSSSSTERSVPCMQNANKTIMFAEDDHDMEMTNAFTGCIDENWNPTTKRDEMFGCLVPATHIISHTDRMAIPRSQVDVNFLNTSSRPALSDPEDMEVTKSQTVVIDAKNYLVNPSHCKARRESFMLGPNKTVVFSETDHEMEMTEAFTGNIMENTCAPSFKNKELDTLSASAKTAPFSRQLDLMGGNRIKTAAAGDCFSVAVSSDPDNMEMTRSQTVVIDSKNSHNVHSSQNIARSVPYMTTQNKTVMFSEEDHDMEMTGALTGHIEENWNPSASRGENGGWFFPATNTIHQDGRTGITERPSHQVNAGGQNGSLWPTTFSNPDDMEMTKSQTVVIDSKHYPINSLCKMRRRESRASLPNKTIMFSEMDHEMEMTDALSGHIVENACLSTCGDKPLSRLSTTTKTVPFSHKPDCMDGNRIETAGHRKVGAGESSDPDDMEITRSQTVVIDSKSCHAINSSHSAARRFSSVSTKNNTVLFSGEDHDMEMTGAFTGRIEENCSLSIKNDETGGHLFLATNTVSQAGQINDMGRTRGQMEADAGNSSLWPAAPSDPDDMEITRSQTVVIDSKNCPINPSLCEARRRESCVPTPNKMVVFPARDRDTETVDSTCRQETSTGSSTTPKTVEHSGVWAAGSSYPIDMEMTRSQTAVIDSNYSGTKKSSITNMRKSLSCISASSKSLMFAPGYCGSMVPKLLTDPETTGRTHRLMAVSDPDGMETRRSQTIRDSGRKVHRMSAPNPTLASSEEDNGMEMTEALQGHIERNNDGNLDETPLELPPATDLAFTSDQTKNMDIKVQEAAAYSNTICEGEPSDDTDVKRSQSISINTRDEEAVNPLTGTWSKCVPRLSISSKPLISSDANYTIDTVENRSATTDGEDRLLGSLPPVNTAPPADLPTAEGNTGPCEQRSFKSVTDPPAGLTCISDGRSDAVRVDHAMPNDKERSYTASSGDYVTIDPSEIRGSSKESVKRPKSRRMSLADLQSKLKNIGHMITEQPDLRLGCHTAPVPQLIIPPSPEAKETGIANHLPEVLAETESPGDCSNGVDSSMKLDSSLSDRQHNMTQPASVSKSKPLASRPSLGTFLPKLPRRSKPLDPNQTDSAGLSDPKTPLKKSGVGATGKDEDSSVVENINEEMLPEMSSEEDLSETVDGHFLRDRCDQDAVVNEMFPEPVHNVAQGQKRPSPVDGHDDHMPEERRIRSPPMLSQVPEQPTAQWDSHISGITAENPPSFMTKTLDSTNFSNDLPNQRYEGTFEMSACRSSQQDIQFDEAYESDLQEKLENGSITMRELLKLCGIDFNIHRPRQSRVPDKFETTRSAEAVLVEKHINRPKQRVYEEDCQELTEMVEKLKTRMRDQDILLKTANEALWEVVRTYSEEQLQSFAAKLKEKKVYFRKKSKALSHELKIALYSKLVQTTQVAQQNLTEKIEDTDDLLKHLDECLNDLETELANMDCAGMEEDIANSETELNLQVKQQEMETLNITLAENERRACELELEKNNTKSKVRKLRDESAKLEKQITILDGLTEWRLSEKTDERAVFTFLHDSMGMEVLFEKPSDENSQSYARLVHNLIGQFIESESGWVQRYPTRQHVLTAMTVANLLTETPLPQLLHDVALVVSRCRLLGEEIHRLQKWGSLKLDILEIDCMDTQVRILFSSLKAFAKFELTLAVSPSYPFSDLQLIHFKNYIGNTRLDQVEEIISSEMPAKNYLTRIVKKIHDVALR
ncbi:hypothetical protein JZ751_010523 [Albula glossodonta]|uniref:Knl1 C-terminal RWD domain-containing protein n=1 Tax=Albula glossodonta TaxID=121402 RepID=A0A8T2NXH0_9TELE|nr:hypothetical protein JZ751_010523 [Albula glossodonta]